MTWMPAAATVIGMLVNLAWTIINMRIREDLAKRDQELKDWVHAEFVSHDVCSARMGAR